MNPMNAINSFFNGGASAESSHPALSPVQPAGTSIPDNAGQTAPQTNGTAANGAIPVDTSTPSKSEAGLDSYKELWKDTSDPNAKPVDNRVFGDIDGAAILREAQKIDFTKVITPELHSAIQAGGEAGTNALIQALNAVAQQTHAQGANAAALIAEQAVAKAKEQFTASLPELMRKQDTNNLVAEDPILSHPAAAPMVAGLVTQLQSKFPTATPAELKQHAQDYFVHFSKSMLGTGLDEVANSKSKNDTDWVEFFK